MVFSSLTFLCIFLPPVIILYHLAKSIKMKNGLLIISSLLFYAYGEPLYIALMILSILFNYCCGLKVSAGNNQTNKAVLFTAVVGNIGLLFVFKYLNFAVEMINLSLHLSLPYPDLPLPVGISFFTFQALSYVIDVYRKEVLPQKKLMNLTLYISFFPQLIAGPIVKYHDIAEEIYSRSVSSQDFAEGFKRFTIGLGKKVLIANQMAGIADTLFILPDTSLNICSAWLAAFAYLFQIYFDFSGYSDMAIGLGRIFGFHFKENFQYPYISCSIQEFWRRWHISLSSWFRDYLYIPLGGNRKGTARTYINKLIVFFCTGLWHGANLTFILWGLWHGLFIILEQKLNLKRFPKFLRYLGTMLIVIIGFVMFRADTVVQGFAIIQKMFTGFNFSRQAMTLFTSELNGLVLVTFAAAGLLSIPYTRWVPNVLQKSEFLQYSCSFLLLFLCLLTLSSGTYNPFIYFRF